MNYFHRRQNEKFMKEIANIKDPAVFLGVARVLSVSLVKENGEQKGFADIFTEVIDTYDKAPRKLRRDLWKVLKGANQEVDNGSGAEDTAESVSNKEM